MILWGVLVSAELAALVLSLLLHRRRHRTAAAFRGPRSEARALPTVPALLAFVVANELIGEALHRWAFAGAPRPFAGTTRVLYHFETGLVLGWPASLVAASWRTFGTATWDPARGRRIAVAGASVLPVLLGVYLGSVIGLAGLHPLGRARTAMVLHGAEMAAVAACAWAIVAGWRRPWGQRQVVVGLLVAVEGTLAMLGPWAHDVFRDWQRLSRVPYLLGFGVVVGLHVVWMRRR